METAETSKSGGFALPGLVIGLVTGVAAWSVIQYWIDGRDYNPLAHTALLFLVTAPASFLLLAERGGALKSALCALAVAALFIVPDYRMASIAGDEFSNLDPFPAVFWFLCRGMIAYVLTALVKAGLESGVPPSYERVFFHGLTMPLIAGGAMLFAGLSFVLLFVWAKLLKELDVTFFNRVFQEPWFVFPFLGAVGGLSIALMRGQGAVLGALRFVLLLLARILIVITALFTVTLLAVLATKGLGPIFDKPYPAAIMLGLSLAGMLIFNGVYQNGEGGPPPLWLRAPAVITLAGFPVYAGLAFYAFALRIGEYGLTPLRFVGLAINLLVAAYAIVCVAGLLTELNWRGKRWMPLVAPLNTAMAALWALALILIATPIINPWAISAQSQYGLVASGRIAAADFDYGYLRFRLGRHGDRALDRLLALRDRPDFAAIEDGVRRARSAANYWEYQNPTVAAEAPREDQPASDDPNR
ncbi:MAG: DUF4153 domain-containing protein [Parvularculaceae bacterium]